MLGTLITVASYGAEEGPGDAVAPAVVGDGATDAVGVALAVEAPDDPLADVGAPAGARPQPPLAGGAACDDAPTEDVVAVVAVVAVATAVAVVAAGAVSAVPSPAVFKAFEDAEEVGEVVAADLPR